MNLSLSLSLSLSPSHIKLHSPPNTHKWKIWMRKYIGFDKVRCEISTNKLPTIDEYSGSLSLSLSLCPPVAQMSVSMIKILNALINVSVGTNLPDIFWMTARFLLRLMNTDIWSNRENTKIIHCAHGQYGNISHRLRRRHRMK